MIAWWQTASEKQTDCKMFGALCYEIRCRQHSFEVMWSLRENTLASFCQNRKGVFRDSENSGGIFALVCSEKMFCLEVKYWACPSRDLAQVTWFEIELPQTGSPLQIDTLPLKDRYAIVNYADLEGGEKKKKKVLDRVLQFPTALGANSPSGIVLPNANIVFPLLVYPHWNA